MRERVCVCVEQNPNILKSLEETNSIVMSLRGNNYRNTVHFMFIVCSPLWSRKQLWTCSSPQYTRKTVKL